jgi:indoleamine 2,3-dioxygenase
MRFYMPKPHREFLQALDDFPFPLREFVMKTADPELSAAFNGAVNAMKEWRDSHMIIATLYIVSPARRAEKERAARAAMFGQAFKNTPVLKGTGGTDLVRFLKSVRTNTAAAMIS